MAAAEAPVTEATLRPFKRVALVGGTHGNESTGVFVLKKLQAKREFLSRPGIEVRVLGRLASRGR